MTTNKHTIACRISDETYNAMMQLIKGEDAKYESISEYIYTLIISDLARRKEKTDISTQILEALNNPAVVERLRSVTK